jgi:hypothetical protein
LLIGESFLALALVFILSREMPRTDVFLKVQIEHDSWERPEDLAEELCRYLRKLHGVRAAELSSYYPHVEPGAQQPS